MHWNTRWLVNYNHIFVLMQNRNRERGNRRFVTM
jgi:hypothetical protein